MSINFEFKNSPKIICKDSAIKQIPFELDYHSVKKPMILSGPIINKTGLLDIFLTEMKGREYVKFLDIPKDGDIDSVTYIKEVYKSEGCDGIIAFGGGSVIDTAKGLRLILLSGKNDLREIAGLDAVKKGEDVPFFVIPTTSGTGSECTTVAVLKDSVREVKLEFISNEMLPDVAFIDPQCTLTLPKRGTGSSALDALSHSVEAYISLQKNPMTDAYALAAMKLIFQNLHAAIKDGRDKKARQNLALASTLAGVAFSNAMVGLNHAIGHAVGAVSHVAHADAMAILLPHTLRFNLESSKEFYPRMLLELDEKRYIETKCEDRAEEFVKVITEFIRSMSEQSGVGTSLSEAGVDKAQFGQIIKLAKNDGAIIVNRSAVSNEEIENILNQAF